MDIYRLKEMLRDQARHMAELAERLDDTGVPMTRQEQQMCRAALAGWAKAMVDEASYMLYVGEVDQAQETMTELVLAHRMVGGE